MDDDIDFVKKANDSDDEDEFEDASEGLSLPSEMDLHRAVEETVACLNLFLSNRFNEARSRMEPWADRSFYHATGYGTILYLQATMTFESNDIDVAVQAVKKSIQVCNRHRKKASLASALTRTAKNYDSYSSEEVHAEICYAECLLERAFLTFIQDENLISFVKGSLKIRACYNTFKECVKILEKRKWKSDDQKVHFESGVYMGAGLFNLLISLLPGKVLRLLEFVGFTGNKKKGMAMLEKGAQLQTSLRGPLCSLALLGYHTVITHVLGTADGDIDMAEQLLKPCIKLFPKAAMFLFFAGRIEEIKGNMHQAITKFEESVESQSEWRQFHHLCFWELMWCHCFIGDWLLAMKYAEKLCKESRWSRSTYTYQKASFLLMCDDQSEDTTSHVKYLYSEVPKLKQRIAGKSIPIEKFAVKKAKRYQEQGNRLTLPAYELIYVWNGFSIVGKKPGLLAPMIEVVEKTINKIVKNKVKYPFYNDDYCLALLLKGTCLRFCDKYFQAEQCFKEIWTLEKQIKQDNYIVPYTLVELAQLYISQNKLNEAKNLLDKAKINYKGYSLESRLHFRIHAAHLAIKAIESPTPESSVADATPPPSPADSTFNVSGLTLQDNITSPEGATNGGAEIHRISVSDRL